MSEPEPDPELLKLLKGSVFESRREQAAPTLTPQEVDRLRRFGEICRFSPGEQLFVAGTPPPGAFVLIRGHVQLGPRGRPGEKMPVDRAGPGQFLAELGQLSGLPAMFDGYAIDAVEAILIRPEGIRSLLVAEADLGERIMRALILRRMGLVQFGFGGPVLVGPAGSPDLIRLQGFLTRNGHPHLVLDPATDEGAAALIAKHAPRPEELPLALCPDGSVLRNPTEEALARCVGILVEGRRTEPYDVAVVGAGPAGLATAVYAASEGLSVLVIDAHAFGGQAGASSRIENYLGFPTGVSGQALAGRAFTQALKFGADFAIPAEVKRLDMTEAGDRALGERLLGLEMGSGRHVRARTVVVASGAQYRRPAIAGLKDFEGRGVSYWASPIEGRLCAGTEVVLVGGGNSAGQAAVFLAGHAARVRMLVRGPGLAATMSSYLVDRIAALPNIELLTETEIVALEGTPADGLQRVRWRHRGTRVEETHAVSHVFLFVGADPATEWTGGALALDAKGFVQTGAEVPGQRTPLPLEGSVPGVFAVGDVRSGSVKRVGGAIGEGAAVVAQIHDFLARRGQRAHVWSRPIGHVLDLKIPPPTIALGVAGLMWLVARGFPDASFVLPGTWFLAPVLALAGMVDIVLGVTALMRAKTTLDPTAPGSSSRLVVTGIYSVTRNPMYLGLLLILIAWGLFLASSLAIVLLWLYGFYLNRFQIEAEERALTSLFGQTFVSYRARVGRWI